MSILAHSILGAAAGEFLAVPVVLICYLKKNVVCRSPSAANIAFCLDSVRRSSLDSQMRHASGGKRFSFWQHWLLLFLSFSGV